MSQQDQDDRALRIFAQYLTQEGKGPSLEELCRAHPHLEERLQRLARRRAEAQTRTPRVGPVETADGRERSDAAGATLPMGASSDEAEQRLADLRHGRRHSRYVLLGEIARGGMGVILHVWDTVLRRPLAMKVIDAQAAPEASGSASGSVKRFLDEAQVAGQLEHPGVVPIHDLGVDEDGRVYFTMPLIEGRDLNEVFDLARKQSEGWSLTRALLALTKVCEVVGYAHARGVIHRDLKPANVMVGKFGETYVMDWGLAKVVGSPEPEAPAAEEPTAEGGTGAGLSSEGLTAGRTIEGTVFGTPAYMAPEQAEGRVADVSFHTDVYAIGAMLYRLLAGRSPYAPRRGKEDAAKTLELVRRGPPTPLERLAPKSPPELVAISEKAMARRPEERYASVQALADDLEAFLEDRVVSAYEGGFWAETKKLVLRNRSLVTMIGAVTLTIFVALVTVTWIHARLNYNLEKKNEELSAARSEALQAAQQARSQRGEALLSSYVALVTSAAASLRDGELAEAKRRLEECPPELRGFEWAHLQLGIDASLRRCRVENSEGEIAGGAPLCLARGPEPGTMVAGYSDGTVRVWDIDEGRERRSLEVAGDAVIALAMSPSGDILGSASADGSVLLHDLKGETSPRALEGLAGMLVSLAFDPEGARLASCAEDGTLRVWELDGSGRDLARVDAPSAVCFAAAGSRLVCASGTNTLFVFDPSSDEEPARLEGHRGKITALAAHPASSRLASASEDGTLRIWDVERLELLEVLAHDRPMTGVALDPSGTLVASGDREGEVRIWDLAGPAQPLSFLGHDADVTAIEFDSSGDRVVSASWDHTLRVWDVRGPTHVSTYRGYDTPFRCADFAADGARVLLGSSDGFVVLYDSLRGVLVRFWTCAAGITAVRFFEDDERVAAASVDGEIFVWNVAESSDEPLVLGGHGDAVYALAVAGEFLISGSGDGTIRFWDVAGARPLQALSEHGGPVLALDTAPGTGRLVSASADRTVRAWGLDAGESLAVLPAGVAAVRAVALHPDGQRVAWGDDDGRLEVVSLSTGETRWGQRREEPIASLAWSPKGDRLVCGSTAGEIQVWNVEGERLFSDRQHPDEVHTVAFDPRGERLLTVSMQGGLRILESTGVVARFRAREETERLSARPGALVERLLGEALDPEEVLQRASNEGDLTIEERELAVKLARSSVYRARRIARTSWNGLTAAGAPLGEYQSALERLREASKLVPGDPAIQAKLGAALVRTGQPAAGVEVLERSLGGLGTADRTRVQAFLGLAYCALGQHSSAALLRDKLRESLPPSPDSQTLDLLAELERCLQGSS